jgi:AraC-like DNA-binding protein
MDLLSTVLRSLRLVDSAVGLFEFGAPWAFSLKSATPEQIFVLGPENAPLLLEVEGVPTQRVEPGDTAVVLGARFAMAAPAGGAPMPLEQVWRDGGLPPLGQQAERTGPLHLRWNVPEAGATAAPDRIITLALQLEDLAHSPVLGVLPRCFVLRGESSVYPWTYPIQRFIRHEGHRQRPGYEAAAHTLAQLTFMELTRSYAVDVGADKASWLKGIADPQIGRALGLIYGQTERDWTLESLAHACQMARSTFSRRFQRLVGRSPMEYLGSVRLDIAARRLRAGERVGNVAASIGYQSEWAFRQAFTRQFGTSPKRYAQAGRP